MNFINFLTCTNGEAGTQCGSLCIPSQITGITSTLYTGLLWGIPLILIIVGMFDMGKAITQQKEDEIKKAQQLLVKKAVAALLVFLMFTIVKMLVGLTVSPDQKSTSWDCIQGILGINKPDETSGSGGNNKSDETSGSGENNKSDETSGSGENNGTCKYLSGTGEIKNNNCASDYEPQGQTDGSCKCIPTAK